MRIDRITGSIPVQTTPASGQRAVRSADEEQSSAPSARVDSVSFSDEGRRLAGLDPASAKRVADVKQRIANGHYDAPAVIRTVASRILGSGDL